MWHVDSVICHVKLAQIIERTTKEVYTLKPISTHERLAAARRCVEALHSWRESHTVHWCVLKEVAMCTLGIIATLCFLGIFSALEIITMMFLSIRRLRWYILFSLNKIFKNLNRL